jgi:hypothetical protein
VVTSSVFIFIFTCIFVSNFVVIVVIVGVGGVVGSGGRTSRASGSLGRLYRRAHARRGPTRSRSTL